MDSRLSGGAEDSPPYAPGHSSRESATVNGLTLQEIDLHNKIAFFATVAGLIVLAASPLFRWISFGSLGIIGLKGDGKIVLAVTLIAIAIFIAGLIKPRCLKPAVLAVSAWATVAALWMAALIWKVSSVFDVAGEEDNPFAALLIAQISPGAGLYLGLLGAVVTAAALCFVAVRRPLGFGSLWPYVATQSVSMAAGLVMAFFVGSSIRETDHPQPYDLSSIFATDTGQDTDADTPITASKGSKREANKSKSPSLSRPFASSNMASGAASLQAQWKKRHDVSDTQWNQMIANFKARMYPRFVTERDWWEEAKNRTPAELNKLYPPLQPIEWYRADWPSDFSFSDSRELDFNFDGGHTLNIRLMVRTEPDIPIKELHGYLGFVKDNRLIYQTQIAERKNISFTDYTFIVVRIPYDDNNPIHRALRFSKDSELTPVFRIRKVVFADGQEKTFN
jgi:hypothetical protein